MAVHNDEPESSVLGAFCPLPFLKSLMGPWHPHCSAHNPGRTSFHLNWLHVPHSRSDLPSMWPPPTYDIKLLKRQTPGLWFFPWGLFECIEWHSKCQAFLFGGPAWLGCPCVDEHYCSQVWLYLCSQDEVAWSHLRPPLGSGMIRMSHPTSLIRKPLELLAGWSCEWPHMKPGVLSNSFPC